MNILNRYVGTSLHKNCHQKKQSRKLGNKKLLISKMMQSIFCWWKPIISITRNYHNLSSSWTGQYPQVPIGSKLVVTSSSCHRRRKLTNILKLCKLHKLNLWTLFSRYQMSSLSRQDKNCVIIDSTTFKIQIQYNWYFLVKFCKILYFLDKHHREIEIQHSIVFYSTITLIQIGQQTHKHKSSFNNMALFLDDAIMDLLIHLTSEIIFYTMS